MTTKKNSKIKKIKLKIKQFFCPHHIMMSDETGKRWWKNSLVIPSKKTNSTGICSRCGKIV